MISELDNLVVIDVETSGVNAQVHDVLSIALCPVDSSKNDLVVNVRHADITWTDYASSIFQGYAEQWRRTAITPREACFEIEEWLHQTFEGRPAIAVGHNVGFDISFIKRLAHQASLENLRFLSHRSIDTHSLLYILFLQHRIPRTALTSEGAFIHFGVSPVPSERHTALGDARATRRLFLRVLDELHALPQRDEGVYWLDSGRPY